MSAAARRRAARERQTESKVSARHQVVGNPCEQCGTVMDPPKTTGRPRRFCGDECRRAKALAQKWADERKAWHEHNVRHWLAGFELYAMEVPAASITRALAAALRKDDQRTGTDVQVVVWYLEQGEPG